MNEYLEKFVNDLKHEIQANLRYLAGHLGASAELAISTDVSAKEGQLKVAVELGGIRVVRVHQNFWIGQEFSNSESEVENFAQLECGFLFIGLMEALETSNTAA